MNQKQSRIVLTLFFVGLVATTAFLTYGLVPRVLSVKRQATDDIPRWKCLEVIAGDLIRVTSNGETNQVHIAGIVAPPSVRGRALEQLALEHGLPVDELLDRAHISRKSLTTWIYRRTVRVIPVPEIPASHPDTLEAYVEISGVDVGRKMLENGQAYLSGDDHDRAGIYESHAQSARAAAIGLWR